jgi:hypothetical protein
MNEEKISVVEVKQPRSVSIRIKKYSGKNVKIYEVCNAPRRYRKYGGS